jgi:hypothetical protein
MKVKRMTIEVEVPIRTVKSRDLLAVVVDYLDKQNIPHQAQMRFEISPNTRIGKYTEWPTDREDFYERR